MIARWDGRDLSPMTRTFYFFVYFEQGTYGKECSDRLLPNNRQTVHTHFNYHNSQTPHLWHEPSLPYHHSGRVV